MTVRTGSDVGLAFALATGAGFATVIGAAFAACFTLANKPMLGVAMGFSAGVMLYLAFADIIPVESVVSFQESFCTESDEMPICTKKDFDLCIAYGTLSFFGGVLSMGLLDLGLHKLLTFFGYEEEERGKAEGTGKELCNAIVEGDPRGAYSLTKVGLMSALAVALHNFPEGLATYVATIADPTAGVGVAFAIALHNIPEGIVVALPVYYRTGSRLQGFLWAFLAGVAEPIGGLIGWLLLSDENPVMFGVVFGFVGGIMVYVALNELLPIALSLDTKGIYAMKSFYAGMVVIAASVLVVSV